MLLKFIRLQGETVLHWFPNWSLTSQNNTGDIFGVSSHGTRTYIPTLRLGFSLTLHLTEQDFLLTGQIVTRRYRTDGNKNPQVGNKIMKNKYTWSPCFKVFIRLFSHLILYRLCEPNRMESDIDLQSPAWQRKQVNMGSQVPLSPCNSCQPTQTDCIFHYCFNPQCILRSNPLILASDLLISGFFLTEI